MSNIYKIKENEVNDFIAFENTNKVIVYYKQNCVFCKLQIDDLNKLANDCTQNIAYAICDITGKTKFCLNNNIVHVPTTQIYKDQKLVKQFETYQEYEALKKELSEV